jgi:hypothetical protein
MFICSLNLTHSFLTVYKIITFKVEKGVFFLLRLKGYTSVLGAKKTISWSKYGLRDFNILFIGELGACPQNPISMRYMEP